MSVPDGESESDESLAAQARGGDRRAFERLVHRHQSSLYRFARRYVGAGDEAYDIVQESFISAWGALARYDPTRRFGAWRARYRRISTALGERPSCAAAAWCDSPVTRVSSRGSL